MIKFRVNGVPAPQGSKRHVGGGRMVESSKAVGPWREAVRAEGSQVRRHDPAWSLRMIERFQPLSVTIVFVLHRPQGHFGTGRNACKVRESSPSFPTGRPDVDKLCRAVLDGLVAGGVMADDSQVVSLNCVKVYASNGEAPGALIEVEAM